MNPLTLILLIPIVGILAWAIVQATANLGGRGERDRLAAELVVLSADLDAVRERIEALEAIATSDAPAVSA